MEATRASIDWSQIFAPVSARVFTADEMARAGSDAPSPTFVAALVLNFVGIVAMVLLMVPASRNAVVAATFVGLAVTVAALANWLWWHPWRGALMRATFVWGLGVGLLTGGVSRSFPEVSDDVLAALAAGCGFAVTMLWFLVVWRSRQIEDRLRAQAEREKAIEMARRLTAAQLEPHFLFNTLSSVQHWVQTSDPRAAPLLEALTTYLRATLPLFDRPSIAAADELRAIESYLRIMQARLGEHRLAWRIEVDADAARACIAPGLLLTLVENAVQHGVEPQLAGGRIELRGVRHGQEVCFEVDDNGPGPAAHSGDGVGLANARQRLALTAGTGARLAIAARPDGGCRAQVRLPYVAEDNVR